MESIGRIILLPKGEYSSSTSYLHLDWVRYQGKAWVSKVDNNVGHTPTEGDYWALLAEDGSAGNYQTMTNKPSINGNTLIGNMTADDLDLVTFEQLGTKITNPSEKSDGQLLTYDEENDVWEAKDLVTYDMLDSVASIEALEDSSDDYVVNAHTVKHYSNVYTQYVSAVVPANATSITVTNSIFENDNGVFKLKFEPNGTDNYPLNYTRYIVTTTAGSGSVQIFFAKAPTVQTNILIEVSTNRRYTD